MFPNSLKSLTIFLQYFGTPGCQKRPFFSLMLIEEALISSGYAYHGDWFFWGGRAGKLELKSPE